MINRILKDPVELLNINLTLPEIRQKRLEFLKYFSSLMILDENIKYLLLCSRLTMSQAMLQSGEQEAAKQKYENTNKGTAALMCLVMVFLFPSPPFQHQKFGFAKYNALLQSNNVTTFISIFSFPLIFSILNIMYGYFCLFGFSTCPQSEVSFLIYKVVSFTKLGKFMTIISLNIYFFYSILTLFFWHLAFVRFFISVLVHTSLKLRVLFFSLFKLDISYCSIFKSMDTSIISIYLFLNKLFILESFQIYRRGEISPLY